MMNLKLTALRTIYVCFILFSCNRENSVSPNSDIANIIKQGNWSVTNFTSYGNDRLYLFGGYRFSFGSNGSVIATKATTSAQGNWSSGSNSGKSFLFLDFASSPSFEQLNGNWQGVQLSSSQIQLQRTNSSGSGAMDDLTFNSL